MDTLIEKMGIYDFFVRTLTGTIVILAADYFDVIHLFNNLDKNKDTSVWIILIAGYFVGIVLEEVSFWIGKLVDCFLNGKNDAKKKEMCLVKFVGWIKVCRDNHKKYVEYKRKLRVDGHDDMSESSLIHIVMSCSFVIAFLVFLLIKGCSNDGWHIVLMLFLTFLFLCRYFHYRIRRVNQILIAYERYYGNDENDDKKDSVNSSTQ